VLVGAFAYAIPARSGSEGRWCYERVTDAETPTPVPALCPDAIITQRRRARRDRFYGLASEVNLELTTYRLYSFFQPWPIPSVIVSWDEATGMGQVEKMGDLKIQLRPVGQAQIWKGRTCGVIWECYFHETGRRAATWQDELYQFWRAVEEDMRVARIFTQPHEPTFEEGYTGFLGHLGYAPDPACPEWWSK
jgi:hypothetical protein